ncbi:MAG: hypothetical protein JWQ98_680 [Chlorobi bacterium]|nr:hypothetical protein [Chlorobiota bacterium]
MKKVLLVIALAAVCASCGGKIDELKKGIDAAQQLSKAGKAMEEGQADAKKMADERAAKGDTVAIPFKDLEGYIPTSIPGYKVEGEPSGTSISGATGSSMSQASQQFVSESGDGSHLTVMLVDAGGTEAAGAYTALSSLGINSEDAHQKIETIKLDPTTSGSMTFNKDNKSSTVTVSTRYRYMVTLTTEGGKEDATGKLKDVAAEIAKKFDGK